MKGSNAIKYPVPVILYGVCLCKIRKSPLRMFYEASRCNLNAWTSVGLENYFGNISLPFAKLTPNELLIYILLTIVHFSSSVCNLISREVFSCLCLSTLSSDFHRPTPTLNIAKKRQTEKRGERQTALHREVKAGTIHFFYR